MIEVTAKPTFEPNATPASRAHCKFAPGESSTWHLSKDKRGRRWNINEIPPNTKAKMLIGWRSRFHPASLENAPQNAPRPLDAGREREEKEHARCSHLDHSFLSSRHQSVIRIVPAKRNLHHHHQISDQKIIRTYPTVIIQRLPDNDYIYPETPASTGPGKALLLLLLLLLHVLQPTRSQHWPSLTGYRTPGGERGATEGGRWSIDRFLTTVVHQGRLEVGKKAIFITREKLRKLGTWGRLSLWTSTLFLRPIFLLRCCYTYGTHVHYVISFRGGRKERKRERKQGRGTHSLERTGGRNTVGYHGELVATLCTGGGRGGTRESREIRETGKREDARVATAWRRLRRRRIRAASRPYAPAQPPLGHAWRRHRRSSNPLWLFPRSFHFLCLFSALLLLLLRRPDRVSFAFRSCIRVYRVKLGIGTRVDEFPSSPFPRVERKEAGGRDERWRVWFLNFSILKFNNNDNNNFSSK